MTIKRAKMCDVYSPEPHQPTNRPPARSSSAPQRKEFYLVLRAFNQLRVDVVQALTCFAVGCCSAGYRLLRKAVLILSMDDDGDNDVDVAKVKYVLSLEGVGGKKGTWLGVS